MVLLCYMFQYGLRLNLYVCISVGVFLSDNSKMIVVQFIMFDAPGPLNCQNQRLQDREVIGETFNFR